MKTLKTWRILFVMTVAVLSLASCSSDLRNGMMGCAEGALTDETGITTQFACHAVYLGGF